MAGLQGIQTSQAGVMGQPSRLRRADGRVPVRDPLKAKEYAACRYLAVPARACTSLYSVKNIQLKRLASAVRFRPWPPFFCSLQNHFTLVLHPLHTKMITSRI